MALQSISQFGGGTRIDQSPSRSTGSWYYNKRRSSDKYQTMGRLGDKPEDMGDTTFPSPSKRPLGDDASDFGDGGQENPGQSGSWSDTTPGYTDAINRRLGGDNTNGSNWSNPPAPAPQAETGGGPEERTPPERQPETEEPPPRWRRTTPGRGQPAGTQPSSVVIDLPTPASPVADAATDKVAPGPGGFTESFTPGTMPSVDQLYKTYKDVFGDQGGMDFINSSQFKSIWDSGNVPWWMLSDPRWRNYLVKTGLLNWDAIRKRLGE